MSDIGAALECPRSAVARKIFPPSTDDLGRLLVTQRGHWLEHGMEQALQAEKLRILPQLELRTEYRGTPIKAHPDFVLVWGEPRPAVRILELKSTGHLPETLYASYEAQVYGQIGLLRSLWNQNTFAGDTKTFPELCEERFGVSLPDDPEAVDMEAWVVCVSLSEAKVFGPYKPDESMLRLCLDAAASLWATMQLCQKGGLVLNGVAYAHGLYPLCGYCAWNRDCPKFACGTERPEWEPDLERLAALKEQREMLNADIEAVENALKDAYALSAAKGWITAGGYRFKASRQPGRRTLDKNLLREHLSGFTGNSYDFDAFFAGCESEGRPFTKLTVGKIKGERHGIQV
jgi:hypothetical protein